MTARKRLIETVIEEIHGIKYPSPMNIADAILSDKELIEAIVRERVELLRLI